MPEPTPLPETPKLRSILEALIFAAEEPLTLDDLEELFPGAPKEALQEALDDVASRWEAEDRGLQVLRVAGGYRLTTRPDLGEWVRALFRARNRRRLSGAALETLAIVAYRQPITTPEIQALRGIDPAGVLQTLLDRRLLKVVGRKKVVGKPMLYGTTPEFLTHFGLNTLADLPTLEEFGALATTLGLPLQHEAPTSTGAFEEEDEDGSGHGDEEFEDATESDSERDDDGDDS
ncbi:MAG TPA: SMC-Scp complex subunit ScpB [Candidatus Polarisedimenticolia bacterium]|nr:SMC-Scp complex subunit ScpB [Candidatus Polarisedimenticolia bacterium]